MRMQRENLLQTVSTGAAKLVRARRWRFAMDEVLGDIATAARVDRAWLFRLYSRSDGERRSSIWHEWGAPGTGFVSLRNDRLHTDMAVRGLRHDHSQTMTQLLDGRLYVCGDVRQLPPLQRATAQSLGIRSIIRAPVLRGGQLWGALGFDSVRTIRHWVESEREALTALATLLSAVLDRDAGINVLWSSAHAPLPVALHAAAAAAIAELHADESLDEGIDRALALLGMMLHAERVWLTENRYRAEGGMSSAIGREWTVPGRPPLRDSRVAEVDVGSGALRRWYDVIYAGQALRVRRDEVSATEAATLDAAGLDQFVAVPVPGMTRRWHGTLNASRPADRPFTDDEVRVLEAVADALHAARDRRTPS